MKRFGWSRPALLIGYVLSDRVELSSYQTFQAYGASVFTRPIVILLLVLVIASVLIALRTKHQGRPAPEETPVHAADRPRAQIAFLAALTLIPLWAIYDSIGHVFSMAVFPMMIGLLTLVPLAFVGYGLLFHRRAHVVFYDHERGGGEDAGMRLGEVHYIAWLVALLLGAAVIGFVFAVAAFLFLFLRIKARASYAGCTLGALAFVALLAVLGHFLALEYPLGILQDYVPMPWPFIS
jgi:hypothetical protein